VLDSRYCRLLEHAPRVLTVFMQVRDFVVMYHFSWCFQEVEISAALAPHAQVLQFMHKKFWLSVKGCVKVHA
jgi:hypothetical protein